MRSRRLAALGAMVLASASPVLADVDRAVRNYQDVLKGTRQLAELTPAEVRELIELDAQLRGRPLDQRTPRQRCIDAELVRLGNGEPTELALRTIDLKCSQR
jgi:hypothetical protein